jgi:hypothetical protein
MKNEYLILVVRKRKLKAPPGRHSLPGFIRLKKGSAARYREQPLFTGSMKEGKFCGQLSKC